MSSGSNLPPYDKPWLSIADQDDRLASRGLVVDDRKAAEAMLWHLNYYRFSGYSPEQISRAIYLLKIEADNPNRSLYDNNQEVYGKLRYGVGVIRRTVA